MALNTTHPVTKQNISPQTRKSRATNCVSSEDHFPRVIICLTRRCRSDGSRRCSRVTPTIHLSTKRITNTVLFLFYLRFYYLENNKSEVGPDVNESVQCLCLLSFLSPRNNCLNKYRRFPSYKYIIGHNVLSKLGGTP